MRYLHWRGQEGEYLNYGLTVYPLSCEHSAGFMFRTDRTIIRLRYSKTTGRWFWHYKRLEPRAWRILKDEE